jgi:hypothetical protein
MPGYEDTLASPRYHGNLVSMGTTKMTKAQMELEIARLRLALSQAAFDLDCVAERALAAGAHEVRGYAEQAAVSVRNALGFEVSL